MPGTNNFSCESMKNILITIEYDGTNYCGWQRQNNGMSIQEKIEDAIYNVTGDKIRIYGSGRTDAGVHAFAQTASFKTKSTIPPESFCKALNSVLPNDISVISSRIVADDFHARFSAKEKHYEYLILNRQCRSPFYKNRAYFYPREIDLNKMQKAALCFCGTHDFSGFMSTGSTITDCVRTIYECKVEKQDDLIKISLKGNGFLYNMVRIVCGTLLHVGIGKIETGNIVDIIESGNRNRGGPTLPAAGLYLKRVVY